MLFKLYEFETYLKARDWFGLVDLSGIALGIDARADAQRYPLVVNVDVAHFYEMHLFGQDREGNFTVTTDDDYLVKLCWDKAPCAVLFGILMNDFISAYERMTIDDSAVCLCDYVGSPESHALYEAFVDFVKDQLSRGHK